MFLFLSVSLCFFCISIYLVISSLAGFSSESRRRKKSNGILSVNFCEAEIHSICSGETSVCFCCCLIDVDISNWHCCKVDSFYSAKFRPAQKVDWWTGFLNVVYFLNYVNDSSCPMCKFGFCFIEVIIVVPFSFALQTSSDWDNTQGWSGETKCGRRSWILVRNARQSNAISLATISSAFLYANVIKVCFRLAFYFFFVQNYIAIQMAVVEIK